MSWTGHDERHRRPLIYAHLQPAAPDDSGRRAHNHLGVGIPVIGVGLLATATTTTTAVDIFATIAMIGSIIVAALPSGRPPGPPSARH